MTQWPFFVPKWWWRLVMSISTILDINQVIMVLSYRKAYSWHSSNMKPPYCSWVHKVFSLPMKQGETAGQLISSQWQCVATWWWQGLTWHCGALLQCNRGHSWMYLGSRTCHCTISAVGPKIVLSRDYWDGWPPEMAGSD
jgi:hypothetical protein